MPTTNPYTFSFYNRNGKLLVNCYGRYSDAPRGGEVLNGCAATRADAERRIAELRSRVTVADSVMLWRYDKAIKVRDSVMRMRRATASGWRTPSGAPQAS